MSSKTIHWPRPFEAPATIAVLDLMIVVSVLHRASREVVTANLTGKIVPEIDFAHHGISPTASLAAQR